MWLLTMTDRLPVGVALQLDVWGMGQVWKCESEGKRNSGRQQLEQNQKKSIEQMGQNSD